MADLGLVAVKKEAWVKHPIGYSFLIKHAHDIEFKKACAPILKGKSVEEILVSDEAKEAVVKHLLVNWKDIEVNGEVLEYSQEKAKEILLDSRYYLLFDFINAEALKLANFVEQEIADTEKN